MRGAGRAVAAVLVTVAAATGCTVEQQGGAASGPEYKAGSALDAVNSLSVKGRAPKTGYDRGRFGSAWADTDSNGCDTRDDILKRDLTGVKFRDGRCTVVSGTLASDPYTGKEIAFARGRSRVDIDHLVALSDAWQKGAQKWDPSKRIALANDPLNLLAVDAGPNRSKGEGDTATWLPPRKGYRCTYVAGQVAVKKKYGLWVTAGERDAMKRVLSTCPDQALPTGGNPTSAPDRFHAK
ncbi:MULTISPECIES: HNH endonuclease family protein [unclassified Streptomyces]|uniref:HNH endonuclease family protein n=1 Tax=unclassified Streptomyces TaxID=2593676 RepID=UPI00224E880E|nr:MULTISPECIES: HNH endonuclease family protein [unclassified Streptomyces]MCX5437831.1 HNH endonuclease family protein [Streptomyces sp. NBC_00063]WUB95587.1 HNH endonuclease family protein [Streptomyces sp. NBC_00569]